MPSSLGPAEILVILVVALIVLGPAKLPQAGRQVGKAISEVRRWSQEVKNEVTTAFDAESAMSSQPSPAAAPYTVSPPEPVSTPDLDQTKPPPEAEPPATAETAADHPPDTSTAADDRA